MDTFKTRPDWHQYFMAIAQLVATRSTCLASPVGAVLVRDKQIIATGYNGVPSGSIHCVDQGFCYEGMSRCDKSSLPSRAIHAEANAIAQAAKYGIPVNGSSIYVNKKPCLQCLKLIIASGIGSIYLPDDTEGDVFSGLYGQLVLDSGVKVHYVETKRQ